MKCLKCNNVSYAAKEWLKGDGKLHCPQCDDIFLISFDFTNSFKIVNKMKGGFTTLKKAQALAKKYLGTTTPLIEAGIASSEKGSISGNIRLRLLFPEGRCIEAEEFVPDEGVEISAEVIAAIEGSVKHD